LNSQIYYYLSPVPSRFSKEELDKSKFHGKNYQNPHKQSDREEGYTYAQTLFGSVKEILKIKDKYPNLPSKKIEDIHNIINSIGKSKPYINMTTKDPSYKQIIVSIGSENINKFMASLDDYISNLNYALKSIKSNTIIDFIHSNYQGLIIMSNKAVFPSNLSMVVLWQPLDTMSNSSTTSKSHKRDI